MFEFVCNVKENELKKFGKMYGKIGILFSFLWKFDYVIWVQVFVKVNEMNMDFIWNDIVEIYFVWFGDFFFSEDFEVYCGYF